MPTRILAFSGSGRTGSFNSALLKIAIKGARAAGANVTELSLRDYAMPLFDGDLEAKEGLPEGAKRLQQVFLQHDALLIACPEYNSSITPLLKNTIDWVSRPAPNVPSLSAYDGKVAGLVAASPGALGGLRGLFHVRDILLNIRVSVLPAPFMIAVPKAHEAFNDDNTLKDAKVAASVEGVGARLAKVGVAG